MSLFKIGGIEVIANTLSDAWKFFLKKRPGIKSGDFVKINKDIYRVGNNDQPIKLNSDKKRKR